MFTCPAITPPDSDEIWATPSMLPGAGPCRFWARSAQKRERESGDFLFFFVRRKCRSLPISSQPNFTKFTYKTWFYLCMNTFGKHFGKFVSKETFFPKRHFLGNRLQQLRTSGRDFSKMIKNLGKSWQAGQPTECWLSICTLGINSKSFPWPAGCIQARTFLDIVGSAV